MKRERKHTDKLIGAGLQRESNCPGERSWRQVIDISWEHFIRVGLLIILKLKIWA